MTHAHPLRSLEDYEAALKEIETYFQNVPDLGTEAAARFVLLSELIKRFEDIHFPIGDGPAAPSTERSVDDR
jgi:HTH-type transcriptional regulator / antitoxin HigA